MPGHEFGGCLATDLPALRLVAAPSWRSIRTIPTVRCAWCREGHLNLCPHVRFFGAPPYNGAMTSQIRVPRRQSSTAGGLTPLDAAMLEPLGVAIHAVDLAKPQLPERVIRARQPDHRAA